MKKMKLPISLSIFLILSIQLFVSGCSYSSPSAAVPVPSSPSLTAPTASVLPTASAAEAASVASLKDDFYAAVNQEWLASAIIPDGAANVNTLSQINDSNEQRLLDLFEQLSNQELEKGTKEQKTVDFYQTVLDTESRNAQGIEPIQKYLDAIDSAETVSALINADIGTYKETGTMQYLSFEIYADAKDSSVNAMYLCGLSPLLSKEQYDAESDCEVYRQYIVALLNVAGEPQQLAEEHADVLLALDKELAEAALDTEEYYDIEKTYNVYSMEQVKALFPNINIEDSLLSIGFEIPKNAIIQDISLAEKSASYFSEENIGLLKLYAKFRLLNDFSSVLSQDMQTAYDVYNASLYGIKGTKTAQSIAMQATEAAMPDFVGQEYIDKYFSEQAKESIEAMIENFISIYKTKIQTLDWLSEETKEKAIKKLENIRIEVGYPDEWPTYLDAVEIVSPKEGGSYFENLCAVERATAQQNRNKQSEPVDKSEWGMSVFTVNACYVPSNNAICFPAGILQSPLYDINASDAENLGAIGVVIAHEISHAFDSNGSQYDENGNAANWWTDDDYANFTEKCSKVESFYDGLEIVPGVVNNGKLTVIENVADLGGISCALKVLSASDNPDYETFFKSFAVVFREVATKELLAYKSTTNIHSACKIRINRSLSTFDEFYNTFGIAEGDGMYVPVEERVSVW